MEFFGKKQLAFAEANGPEQLLGDLAIAALMAAYPEEVPRGKTKQ